MLSRCAFAKKKMNKMRNGYRRVALRVNDEPIPGGRMRDVCLRQIPLSKDKVRKDQKNCIDHSMRN